MQAADGQAALNGDPVALIGVRDDAMQQFLPVGFFDMLQGLKLADRLGLGWYDEAVSDRDDWCARSGCPERPH